MPKRDFSRQRFLDCRNPENAFLFQTTADYLSMFVIIERALTQALQQSCSLTILQYRILLFLNNEDRTQVSQLADQLDIGISTISMAVSKLAERKLVARTESATDMRLVYVTLSKQGQATFAKADDVVLDLVLRYMNMLSSEQLTATVEATAKISDAHFQLRTVKDTVRLDTALVDTVVAVKNHVERHLADAGFTLHEFRILLAANNLGAGCSCSEVAAYLFLNASDIASGLKKIEKLGLIERERSPQNRRIRAITLTPEGHVKAADLLLVTYDGLIESYSIDNDLINVFVSVAQQLVERLRSRPPLLG